MTARACLCPACLGVFPGEGPDGAVCRCGTTWYKPEAHAGAEGVAA